MISNCTVVSVVWNEALRIAPLVSTLASWFEAVVVVVQESDDRTLAIARKILDQPTHHVIEDEWRGIGDLSMPLALSHVSTEWALVISGDEFPDIELLRSIPDAIAKMESQGNSGAFIEFSETVDGVPFVQHGRHVRLFRASGGWEARHHSAASHENVIEWKVGSIIHTRSLKEMCEDYLRQMTMLEEEGERRLLEHNAYTVFAVCNLVAGEKGWRYVRALEQWPEIERRVFARVDTGLEVL